MSSRGKLIAIGGAENRNHFEKEKLDVLARILKEMKGRNTVIEIIPTASGIPTQVGREYDKAFHSLGCKDAAVMNIRKKSDTEKDFYCE